MPCYPEDFFQKELWEQNIAKLLLSGPLTIL